MAVCYKTSIINSCKISLGSYKIKKLLNNVNRPAFLRFTPLGIEFIPQNSEKVVKIGCIYINKELTRALPLKYELLIDPHIKGGMIRKCLKSIIEEGLANSGDVLEKSGIKVLPDIKTIEDLANHVSDRLKNQIFCTIGCINNIRDAVDNLQIKIFALEAAVLLGQDTGTAAISADLSRLKDPALYAGLLNPWTKTERVIDDLYCLPPTKGIENTGKGNLTIEELSAYISEQLKKSRLDIPKTITSIETRLKNMEKTVADPHTDQDIATKINVLSKQTAILYMILDDIRNSAKKSWKIIDGLIDLSINHRDQALTAELLDKTFKKKDLADKVIDKKKTLPQITEEMASKVNILFVDDEPGVRDFLKKLFEDQGFRVITAESGESGLEKLEQGDFDIIFSDFSMPGMDGVDLIRTLRQSNKVIPAYIISASPLKISPPKLGIFIAEGNAEFIVKDIANMHLILKPAIETAQIKAGIAVNKIEVGSLNTNTSEEKPASLLIWKRRLAHKLNNLITPLGGYSYLLSKDIYNIEYFNAVCKGFDKCIIMIEALSKYAKEFNKLQKGDMELLPKALKEDKDTVDAIRELSAGEEIEYNKIPMITAAIAILYKHVLDEISEQLKLFEINKDKPTIAVIKSIGTKLNYINDALVRMPENEEMALASKTIEYILATSEIPQK